MLNPWYLFPYRIIAFDIETDEDQVVEKLCFTIKIKSTAIVDANIFDPFLFWFVNQNLDYKNSTIKNN